MTAPLYPSKRAYTYQPGSANPSGSIILWDDTTPTMGATIVLQIFGNPNNPSSIPIREVYIPVILGPIAFYLGYQGVPAGVEPNYVTQGSGCECVDFDGVAYLTLAYVSGTFPGESAYIFVRSLPTGPFRFGPLGAQVTSVTATAPIESSGGSSPNISLQTPLPIADGGTGTASPQLISGTGIVVTGTPFNWTISATNTGISNIVGAGPITVAGGSGPTTTIGLNTPLALNYGGTGYTAPVLNVEGAGLSITGTIFQPTGVNAWTIENTGVTSCTPGGNPSDNYTGAVLFESTDGSVNISKDDANNAINFSVVTQNAICVSAHLSPTIINGAGETVTLPTLPNGQWFVEVIVHGFALGQPAGDSGCTGNTIQLTGAGWGTSVSDYIIQCQGTRTLYQCASVPGGSTPSVTITGSGVTLGINISYISLGFKAFRIV